jgi:MFS family permease
MSLPVASVDSSPGRELPYALRSLRHRNFCLFFIGQFISRTGYWMQGMALGWLVYRLSESPFMLGLSSFVGQIPAVILGLFAGVVADRFSRYKVCLCTQVLFMVQALTLGILTSSGVVTIWQVMSLALLAGVLVTFEMPARQTFLQEIVPKKDLASAIALNSALVNAARILGPALAGLMVAHFGEGTCFTINGFCYLAIIGGFLAMRLPEETPPPPPTASTWTFIWEGVTYAAQTPAIRLLLLLIAILSLLTTPYTVLMPIFARDILHGGPGAMGTLMGATGAGAVIGVYFLARQRDTKNLGRFITFGLLRLAVGLMLFSLSRNFWLSLLLLPLVGSGFMVPMSTANTLLQTLTPVPLQGRIMSLFLMMFMGTPPVGSLLAGALAPHIGAPLTVGITGIACLGAAGWFWLRVPLLEQATAAEEEMAGQEPLQATSVVRSH